MDTPLLKKRGRPKTLTTEQIKVNQHNNFIRFYMRKKFQRLGTDLKKLEDKFNSHGYNIKIKLIVK